MFKKLNNLFEKKYAAEREVYKEIARLYPVGTTIFFQKGRGSVTAEVIWVHSENMMVKNIHTGKEYRISIYPGLFPEIVETP